MDVELDVLKEVYDKRIELSKAGLQVKPTRGKLILSLVLAVITLGLFVVSGTAIVVCFIVL